MSGPDSTVAPDPSHPQRTSQWPVSTQQRPPPSHDPFSIQQQVSAIHEVGQSHSAIHCQRHTLSIPATIETAITEGSLTQQMVTSSTDTTVQLDNRTTFPNRDLNATDPTTMTTTGDPLNMSTALAIQQALADMGHGPGGSDGMDGLSSGSGVTADLDGGSAVSTLLESVPSSPFVSVPAKASPDRQPQSNRWSGVHARPCVVHQTAVSYSTSSSGSSSHPRPVHNTVIETTAPSSPLKGTTTVSTTSYAGGSPAHPAGLPATGLHVQANAKAQRSSPSMLQTLPQPNPAPASSDMSSSTTALGNQGKAGLLAGHGQPPTPVPPMNQLSSSLMGRKSADGLGYMNIETHAHTLTRLHRYPGTAPGTLMSRSGGLTSKQQGQHDVVVSPAMVSNSEPMGYPGAAALEEGSSQGPSTLVQPPLAHADSSSNFPPALNLGSSVMVTDYHRIMLPSDRQYPVFTRDNAMIHHSSVAIQLAGTLLQRRGHPWDTGIGPATLLSSRSDHIAQGSQMAAGMGSTTNRIADPVPGVDLANNGALTAAHGHQTKEHMLSNWMEAAVAQETNDFISLEPTTGTGIQDGDPSVIQPILGGQRADLQVPNYYQPPALVAAKKAKKRTTLSTKDINILLLHVARIGDLNSLRCLTRPSKLDVNLVDDEGRTALMFACMGDHSECITVLLERGALVHLTDFAGRTPLHWAARFGRVHAVQILLRAGANPLSADYQGKSALHAVMVSDNVQALQLLINSVSNKVLVGQLGLLRRLASTPMLFLSSATSPSNAGSASTPSTNQDHGTVIHDPNRSGLNCLDDDSMTPLMWAAHYGHYRHVRLLIQSGALLTLQDIEGKTALHWAMSNKHVHVVQLLVESCFDLILKRDRYGRTPLHLACAEGNIGVVYFLIGVWNTVVNERDDVGRTSLHWAAICGKAAIVKLLCEFGAKLNKRDRYGATALHYAAQQNFQDCVHLLLRKGASVTVKDEFGRQPLMWASIQGHVEVAKMLLNAKAEVNVREDHGLTALHFAAYAGHTACCLYLIRNQANVNSSDFKAHTPLFRAAMAGHTETALALISEGADVTARDLAGRTPLHWSCTVGHIDVVNILVGHGADIFATDNKGTGPLHEAAFHGKTDILMYLISRGANVDVRDLNGVTALHWAAVNGHLGCCRLLLANGADINAMVYDSDRDTPLDYAQLNSNLECSQFLIDHGGIRAEAKIAESAKKIQRTWRIHKGICGSLQLSKANAKQPASFKPSDAGHTGIGGYRKTNSIHASLDRQPHRHRLSTLDESASLPRGFSKPGKPPMSILSTRFSAQSGDRNTNPNRDPTDRPLLNEQNMAGQHVPSLLESDLATLRSSLQTAFSQVQSGRANPSQDNITLQWTTNVHGAALPSSNAKRPFLTAVLASSNRPTGSLPTTMQRQPTVVSITSAPTTLVKFRPPLTRATDIDYQVMIPAWNGPQSMARKTPAIVSSNSEDSNQAPVDMSQSNTKAPVYYRREDRALQ